MMEPNANYDEDQLFCSECGAWWSSCTCDLAAQMREEFEWDDEANSIEEQSR